MSVKTSVSSPLGRSRTAARILRQPIPRKAGDAPGKTPSTTPASWYPYSHSGKVPFRHPLTPADDTVRVDTQPNGNDATEVFLPVQSCYLFGPIDVAPGDASNTVDLSAG